MFTFSQFISEWKRLHHPTMNVDSDVAFFYQLYGKLYHLMEQEACRFDNSEILFLLLYTENAIAVGLDGFYGYRYRSLGDIESRWCDGLDMSIHAGSQVHNLVSEAVADARCSALRQWMTESVLSGVFSRLSEMLVWFAREDKNLRLIYPDLRYRKAMFMRLAGNKRMAGEMLWSDIAFNWRDKRGDSLAKVIARQFRRSSSAIEEKERALLKEVTGFLGTLRTERMDTYTVVEGNGGYILTLRHRDGRVFRDVTFPMLVPENAKSRGLAAQLVTYRGKIYINGPIVWLAEEVLRDWNGENVWNDILKKEQDAAKQVCFTTPFGRQLSLYEDFYTVPEDPEEAWYADMGIYFDEPNIFDFLEGLKPSEL